MLTVALVLAASLASGEPAAAPVDAPAALPAVTPAVAPVAAPVGAGPAGAWAVVPLEGINVHEGHMAAARQVLKDHLASLGQATVALGAGVADPAAAAREKGATAVLRGTLVRLGQKVKVNLTLAPLEGAPKTAALDAGSPEDLDPVLMRLARFLVKGDPIAEPTISEVTEQEADAYDRKQANSYLGVTVGGVAARSGSAETVLSGPSLYWLYDARTFFADIQFGFAFDQDDSGGGAVGLSVGLLYPLLDRDLTPFLGGGLGYGSLDVEGLSGSGLQLFADAGAIWGRTSSVHFRGDLKPFLTTYKLSRDVWNGSGLEAGGKIGWGVQVALGVGF